MATTKTDPKIATRARKNYEGLTNQQLIDAYRLMFMSRRLDDR